MDNLSRAVICLILLSLTTSVSVQASALANSYENFIYPNLRTYFVSPNGNDNNPGTKSQPLRYINTALSYAEPGERVYLMPGEYFEDIKTVRSGTPDQPILIYGSKKAIVKGAQKNRIFQIFHSYIHLRNFSIDGKVGAGNAIEDFRDILVWVQGQEIKSGPKGVVLRSMILQNAGGECVRLKYFVTQAEIFGNLIRNCGVYDFQFAAGGKNGEGIYIGTAPEQWDNGKNPSADPDHSNGNWVWGNKFYTYGNECVDIKEGAEYNLIEYNACQNQLDPNSGGFDARGDNNIFRYNIAHTNTGAGVRLGGDLHQGRQYGINNQVYGNIIYGNGHAGVKVMSYPQDQICSNMLFDNGRSDFYGNSGIVYDPGEDCQEPPPETPPEN
ncbi:DUF1565 domain-containing protein [Oleiphilus messinensis]|nr:DUF1565 domain-containing protein [Oleiphilus messinensis]